MINKKNIGEVYSVTEGIHVAGTYYAGINLNKINRPLSSESVSISKKMVTGK